MSTTFIKAGHTDQILKKLWQKCQNEVLCDVVLIAGNEKRRIPAHRNILLEASEYFVGILTSSVHEGTTKEVEITHVNGVALQSLLEYCYKGCVVISEDNVFELLKTAHMLLLRDVVTACGNFMAEHLNPCNCLEFGLLAERYQCELLLQKSKEYSLKNLIEISRTTEFLQLNVEQLKQLLACKGQRVAAEKDVFNSLKAWLEHDPIKREQYKVDLLALVRMSLLERTFLIKHVKPICTSVECFRIYVAALECHPSYDNKMQSGSNLTKSKSSDQILMGISVDYSSKELLVHYYCPQQKKWMKWLKELQPRFGFAVALMKNCLYFIGGNNFKYAVNTFSCVNLTSMTFIQKTPMAKCREGCGVAVLNGFLYVVGGCYGRNYLNSVEKWNSENNEWVKVASMSVNRRSAGVAVLNEKIYVVGGASVFKSPNNSAEFYDPIQNVWQSIAPMGESRKCPGLAVANGLLYAVGGDGTKTVECYDPQTDKWTFISSLSEKFAYGVLCTTLNDKVVVSFRDRFEEYDAVSNEWKKMEFVKRSDNMHSIFSYSGILPTSQFSEM